MSSREKRRALTRTGWRNSLILVALVFSAIALRCVSLRGRLSPTAPLPSHEFSVVFTNPQCKTYAYERPVVDSLGNVITTKPVGAYCSKLDAPAQRARTDGPLHKLLSWIESPDTREIFIATLSMNSEIVAEALCRASTERGVRITVVYDANQVADAVARLPACAYAKDPSIRPKLFTRGGEGDLGYAHDKFALFNPRTDRVGVVFGSGNMTKGLELSHENWNFVSVSGQGHFASVHQCAARALVDAGESVDSFRRSLDACRSGIVATRESDIRAFFVPADADAARFALTELLRGADEVRLAAHVLTLPALIDQLALALSHSTRVQILLDDDTHWARVSPDEEHTSALDAQAVARLRAAGAVVRYLETNSLEHIYQHNKFALVHHASDNRWSLFTGAGNFSTNAFRSNFENFYRITIPDVVSAYLKQFDHLFGLATPPERMPNELVPGVAMP